MKKKPHFARYLTAEELSGVGGGDPKKPLPPWACQKNPNCDPIAVTLKAGTCGNDCDHPGNPPLFGL